MLVKVQCHVLVPMLPGFRVPLILATSTESRTLLLLCTLLHAGSLTLAPCALARVLAQRLGQA